MRKTSLIIILTLSACLKMSADEGMWMIHAIDAALEKKMQERGLAISAKEIYNADAPGASLADAVVSMDFGCTGSIISDEGLVITNHHCAYSDVHALSTPEHNYLEEGFWAMTSKQEVRIPGKSIYLLKRVVDVTDEVAQIVEDLKKDGKPVGMRKISHLMEAKWSKQTGLDASMSSYWSGSKYYMALYEVYKDIRLVAAPPVSIAAFGGDIDNWEWPQHKCDFAMYRIYTDEGKPLHPQKKLEISLEGYKRGDYTMVIGYPGRTDRYSSSAKVAFEEMVSLPIANRVRGEQMEIISRWMNEDPAIRLKYSDYYFSLSNFQELGCGEALCYKRFGVAEQKREMEDRIGGEIKAIADKLEEKYAQVENLERSKTYFRETFFRGSRIGLIIRRSANCQQLVGLPPYILDDFDEIDLRVEKELLNYSIVQYLENVDRCYWSDIQKKFIEYYTDYRQAAEDLWNASIFTNQESIQRMKEGDITKEEVINDPIAQFMLGVKITEFNSQEEKLEGSESIQGLTKAYTQALYAKRLADGTVQYPDANSTMRITYGQVCNLEPHDGVVCDWKTTPGGILEKENPASYDFALSDRASLLYSGKEWGKWGFDDPSSDTGKGMYVDFLTDNDITGGNSGSPVLNAEGKLIGLAFDGNKESLASDATFVEDYNRCVCVDIRFILWILDRYAGMQRIIEEIGL